MDPFLKIVAQDIYSKYGNEMQNIYMVFPNRRSILFFNKQLSQIVTKISWAPKCVTISDYFQNLSTFQSGDKLQLLFDLYKTYRHVFNSSETFDNFFYWGELMLSDFNDIDKYLIDAEDLFKNLSALKNINERFSYLDNEQLEAIQQFWNNFAQSRQSSQHDQFLFNWSLMFEMYNKFKSEIGDKNIAYEGMQYRQVAERVLNNSFEKPVFKKIAFVGFNALSECEKVLFKHLRNIEKAVFYWDYSEEIIQLPYHEAGYFIRQNITEFPSALDKKYFEFNIPEKIELIAVPSNAGQAKISGQIIKKNFLNETDIENSAIILTDENMLMPVLHSLPPELNDINITMGYPVKNSSIVSLIESMGQMYAHASRNNKNELTAYYYKDVLEILNHPYVAKENFEIIRDLKLRIINKNLVFISPTFFTGTSGKLNLIFDKPNDSNDFLTKITSLIRSVGQQNFGNNNEVEEQPEGIEAETLIVIYSNINRLLDLLSVNNLTLDIPLCFRLLRKVLNNLTLPFEGEPLKGLQIMGLLESRAIDFENIILLNVNEGFLPKTNVPSSFIPYNLRHGFGLPTLEHRDAIYAYYFYRLMQRAKNIYLLYSTRPDKMGSSEISRYATQMLYNEKFKITRRTQTFNIIPSKIPEIEIKKSDEILKILNKYIDNSKTSYYLSPTALSNYIECKLRFYFRYVAGLKEHETPAEEIDPSLLGSILHNAMFNLYRPFLTKSIQSVDLESLLKSTDIIEKALLSAITKDYFKEDQISGKDILKGRNIIIFRILEKYIRQILKVDMEITPFSIISLENNVTCTFEIACKFGNIKVRVGGNIDRVDRVGGNIRIIDYKTGSVENKFKDYMELFSPEEGKKAKKEIFQAILYSLIYKKTNNTTETISPGLYRLREIFEDKFDPGVYFGKEIITDIANVENLFENNLKNLLREIYSLEIPFSQTSDLKKCSICDYKVICHHENGS